jgi:hypothetical protein
MLELAAIALLIMAGCSRESSAPAPSTPFNGQTNLSLSVEVTGEQSRKGAIHDVQDRTISGSVLFTAVVACGATNPSCDRTRAKLTFSLSAVWDYTERLFLGQSPTLREAKFGNNSWRIPFVKRSVRGAHCLLVAALQDFSEARDAGTTPRGVAHLATIRIGNSSTHHCRAPRRLPARRLLQTLGPCSEAQFSSSPEMVHLKRVSISADQRWLALPACPKEQATVAFVTDGTLDTGTTFRSAPSKDPSVFRLRSLAVGVHTPITIFDRVPSMPRVLIGESVLVRAE